MFQFDRRHLRCLLKNVGGKENDKKEEEEHQQVSIDMIEAVELTFALRI